jgi:hypothetical protein
MVGVGRHVSRLGGYAPALPTPFGDSGDLDPGRSNGFAAVNARKAPPPWSWVEQPARLPP